MKYIFFLSIAIVISNCTNPNAKQANASKLFVSLNKMAEAHNYFALEEMYHQQKNKLQIPYSLYFEAILANAFNKPQESNKTITAFLNAYPEKDSLSKKMLQAELINHIYLSEYEKALKTNEILQEDYVTKLDSLELADLKNTHKIWSALKNIAKQEVIKKTAVTLPVKKDMAGLSTILITSGGKSMDFVFDTGANFSVIQKSVARELGMKIIPSNFTVEAVTGLEVKSDLAVADQIKLGDILLKNVVFLAFNDTDLSFPSIGYEIKGIIGFPVIKDLDEIEINKNNNNIFIPKKAKHYRLHNLAFDEYMPIVKTKYGDKSLYFNFDTGAQKTALYAPFYNENKAAIEQNAKETIFKTGGAGGHIETKGFIVNNVTLEIGKASASLDSLQLFPNTIGTQKEAYGNLGQDYIQQFNTMIINFKDASLIFK
ncbi:retropepsin-like aspartic protease [Galbibacter sp. PAP.153]|uniref:retropepsin-like aspartic protease n=1 Tax=Galbibacter sp. PAP.153 TaxID=3104623 RepID=UPI00300A924E